MYRLLLQHAIYRFLCRKPSALRETLIVMPGDVETSKMVKRRATWKAGWLRKFFPGAPSPKQVDSHSRTTYLLQTFRPETGSEHEKTGDATAGHSSAAAGRRRKGSITGPAVKRSSVHIVSTC